MKRWLIGILLCGWIATGVSAQPAVGVWENVTPPEIPLNGNAGVNCDYGTLSVAVNPQVPTTVYLASCERGLFKSVNSGASWVKINTGVNAAAIDTSRQWTLVIDPVNPQILYTNSGYGAYGSGAWKSLNGGVDWQPMWPPPAQPELNNVIQYNFVAQVTLDPTDHLHVFLSWHGYCAAPYTTVCYGESHDGGDHWVIRNGDPNWAPSEAQTIYAIDGQHWLFANHADGLWATSNAGASWTLVNPNGAGHWPAQLHIAAGKYYIGSDVGIFRSTDGVSWTQVYSGSLTNGLVGDGTNLFASNFGALTPWIPEGSNPYVNALVADDTSWSAAPWSHPAPSFTQGSGAGMAIDTVNHIVYSSNGTIGLWRVKYAAGAPPPPPPAYTSVIWDQVAPNLSTANGYTYRAYFDDGPGMIMTSVSCVTGMSEPITCSWVLPTLTTGTHTLQLTAANQFGESVRSMILTIIVGTPDTSTPAAPQNLRLG
jgi:hypothetical protein